MMGSSLMRCDFMSEVSGCAAGIACSMMIAQVVYDVPAVVILNSCVRAITAWDLITSMIKAWVFGAIISIVRTSLVDKLMFVLFVHARLHKCHFTGLPAELATLRTVDSDTVLWL